MLLWMRCDEKEEGTALCPQIEESGDEKVIKKFFFFFGWGDTTSVKVCFFIEALW